MPSPVNGKSNIWSMVCAGVPSHGDLPTTRAGTPATVVFGGTGFSTTEPAATREQAPTSILPSTLAPAESSTPRRILGCRSPRSLPVPPSVTPCRIDTSSSITAVCPSTMPVPWSIKTPRPILVLRIDVDAEYRRRAALQIEREILAPLIPEKMREAMRLQRMKAFVIEHRLDIARGRGIALGDRHDIGADRVADRGFGLECLVEGMADQLAGDIGVVEPRGDAVRDRLFEPVVVEHGRENERRELRRVARDLFRFLADARPYRIEAAKALCELGLMLGHGISPGGP